VLRAALFRSTRRVSAFRAACEELGVDVVELDWERPEWLDFDFQTVDFLIYFPEFQLSSSHPLSLWRAKDNIRAIVQRHPRLRAFPDPSLLPYYGDKYPQHLFLRSCGFPIPETWPVSNERELVWATDRLGYPFVMKNRFGASGDFVRRIDSPDQALAMLRSAAMDCLRARSILGGARRLMSRHFWYEVLKIRQLAYPFFSLPLLAQKFVPHARDLKTVVCGSEVVEAHWREKADASMWKMNIDSGGVGVWTHVPDDALELSSRLAQQLRSTWLNIDLLPVDHGFLISEFSPVWHHYSYREKPSFVYRSDYNVKVPIEEASRLEPMIVRSLVDACTSSPLKASAE
jgi:hypothetical protein